MPVFKPVVRTKITTGRKKIYNTFNEINSDDKFSMPPIYECLNKKRKDYKGYRWRYLNE